MDYAINWNMGGQQQRPGQPGAESPEMIDLRRQIELLNQQNAAERQKQELMRTQMPELTYNPIVETVGPDGKKTVGLREELQLRSPEEFITKEQERMGLEQTQMGDQMTRQMMQQQALQRAEAMRRGGARAGTGAMDRYSMREAMLARQGLAGQGMKQRAEFASKAEDLRSQAQKERVGLLGGAIKDVEQFNLERWKKLKDVEASKYQAEATRAAGGGGGKK